MVTLYGISNCDTVKKARAWLQNHDIEFRFHDFRKDGLSQAKLKSWMSNIEWETLLNKRGTTWRQLDETNKENINKSRAIKLMIEQPTLIKRPVMEFQQSVFVGFKPDIYQSIFS